MATYNLNELQLEEMRQELARMGKRTEWGPQVIEIRSSGTKIYHNLGVIPKVINIMPITHKGISSLSWRHYQQPDAKYVYLKSEHTGSFIVYLSGG